MGSPNDTGFLVDQSVKEKVGSRIFRVLHPVKANGDKEMVTQHKTSQRSQLSMILSKKSQCNITFELVNLLLMA